MRIKIIILLKIFLAQPNWLGRHWILRRIHHQIMELLTRYSLVSRIVVRLGSGAIEHRFRFLTILLLIEIILKFIQVLPSFLIWLIRISMRRIGIFLWWSRLQWGWLSLPGRIRPWRSRFVLLKGFLGLAGI